MKKIMTTVLAILILTSTLEAGNLIGKDKISHFIAGLGIYAGCYLIKSIGETANFNMSYLDETTCLVPVIVAGVGKEIYDSQYPASHSTELMDVVATVAQPLGLAYTINF